MNTTISGSHDHYVFSASGITLTNLGSLHEPAGSAVYANAVDFGDVVINIGDIAGSTYGVKLGPSGTVANAGTIAGQVYAVKFTAGYDNRLIFDPGAVFVGTVDGGNPNGPAVSVLELASGASNGTISGIGTQFIGFDAIAIDPGSQWVLAGANSGIANITFGTAATLENIGSVGGYVAIRGQGGTAAIVNAGSVAGDLSGSEGWGIVLDAGGSVVNLSGGTIGGFTAIETQNAPATVVNAGSIVGNDGAFLPGAGVFLVGGGSVTNRSGGSIVGPRGIYSAFYAATVVNAGDIGGNAAGYDGIALTHGGLVVNQTGGSIGGARAGVYFKTGGSLENQSGGTIAGQVDAVKFTAGYDSRLIFDPGAVFAGTVDGGNPNGPAVSVLELASGTSDGTISGVGTQFIGFDAIAMDNSARWVLAGANSAIANITFGTAATLENIGSVGGYVAIRGHSGTAAIVNAGSIAGDLSGYASWGIVLDAGGSIVNLSGGTIGGFTAIETQNAPATVVNAGSIVGNDGAFLPGAGVFLVGGGSVTNRSGGSIVGPRGIYSAFYAATVVNAGDIGGNAAGYDGIALTHGGLVVNQTGGSIGGARAGVYFKTGGSLENQSGGTIAGQVDAVKFTAGYDSRLIFDPGAVFAGTVDGGNPNGPAVSVLELASGASNGTISGIGTQFIGFDAIAIDAGARWMLAGSNTIAAGVTLTANSATLIDHVALANFGAIVLDPSTMVVGDLYGTGSVTIQAGSTLEVTGSIASTETIVFQGPNGYLHLDNPAGASGSVIGFDATDIVDLKGVDPGSVSYGAGALSFQGGHSFPLTTAPGAQVRIAASADGTEVTALCFLPDTLIETPGGQMTVQDLRVGDIVATWGGKQRSIAWIGTGSVVATAGHRGPATPVIVRKGALGPNMPFRDLHVTKGHSLLLDGVLIPVEFLVNHRSIVWDDRSQEATLYHIELDSHDVLIANGAPAESYRDDGNRWLFLNANTGWNQPPKDTCAPVLTGGRVVDTVWKRLLDRSGPRRIGPLTDDPDLYLLVDGVRTEATLRHNKWLASRYPGVPNGWSSCPAPVRRKHWGCRAIHVR